MSGLKEVSDLLCLGFISFFLERKNILCSKRDFLSVCLFMKKNYVNLSLKFKRFKYKFPGSFDHKVYYSCGWNIVLSFNSKNAVFKGSDSDLKL